MIWLLAFVYAQVSLGAGIAAYRWGRGVREFEHIECIGGAFATALLWPAFLTASLWRIMLDSGKE